MDFKPSKGQIVMSENYFQSKDKFQIEVVIEQTDSLWRVHFRSLKDSKIEKKLFLSKRDLAKFKLIETQDLQGDAELVSLGLQARFIKLFRYTDPIVAVPTTIVPYPHQASAVMQMGEEFPLRFMLADEAGAGKTIMAGLFFQQLEKMKQAYRTLIVVPPILLDKWRKEMSEMFEADFNIITSSELNRESVDAIWRSDRPFLALASIDLLKREDYRKTLESVKWDFVVVDEAHKMSARIEEKSDRADTIVETARYKLGKVLQKNTEHLLLMSATPHKGKLDSFSFLMSLLDPVMDKIDAKTMQSLINAQNRLIRHRFLRRMKENMIKADGSPLFSSREATTSTFSLKESDSRGYRLYEDITNYIKNIYGKGIKSVDGKKPNVIGFVKQIFQRRLASSTYAAAQTLNNRLEKIEKTLDSFTPSYSQAKSTSDSPESSLKLSEEEINDIEDLPEGDRDKRENELVGDIINFDIDKLKEEKKELVKLIDTCHSVLNQSDDPKINTLKEALGENPNKKVVVFTEYKDTLDYIKERLANYTSVSIDGSVPFKKRAEAMKAFKIPLEEGGPQIMIATDAAGEGIDLHTATVLINYDIPWNPNRLEQRMGRIHRIGQEKPVVFINIVAEDTREGAVLDALFRKLDLIGETIGKEKVFDVISDLISGKTLVQVLSDALYGNSPKGAVAKMNEKMESNLKEINRNELNTIDLDWSRHDKLVERPSSPHFTQSFLYKSLKYLGAKIEEEDEELKVLKLPNDLKDKLPNINLPLLIDLDNRPKSSEVSVISLTSDSFAFLLEHIQEMSSIDIEQGAVLFGEYIGEAYSLWFFEIAITRIRKGKTEVVDRRIIAFKSSRGSNDGNHIEEYDPRGVINLHAGVDRDFKDFDRQSYILQLKNDRNRVVEKAYDYAEKYKGEREMPSKELWKERLRMASLRVRRYSDLYIQASKRKVQDDSKKKEAWKRYEESKREYEGLEKDAIVETTFELEMLNLFCKVIVLPKVANNSHNIDVERRAMEYTLKYEKAQGRSPIDVSTRGKGYDIVSEPKSGLGDSIYIEVKGRSPGVKVMLEETEIIKAKRFGDRYWLYLYVFEDKNSVEFIAVQNPIKKLPLKQITRSTVSIAEVRKVGEML